MVYVCGIQGRHMGLPLRRVWILVGADPCVRPIASFVPIAFTLKNAFILKKRP